MGEMRHWIASTNTHRVMQEVLPLDGGSAKESLDSVGSGTFTLPIGRNAMNFTYEQGLDLTKENARFLIQGTESRIEYCGLIRETEWDENAEAYQVRTEEARTIFAWRHPHYVGEYGTPASTVTLTNVSERHALSHYLDLGANRGRVRWDLRMTAGIFEWGSFSDTLERAKLTKLEHAMKRIERLPNGPNLHLKPTWEEPGLLRFERRIGNPRLNLGTYDFTVGVGNSPLEVGKFTKDGTEQATGLIVQADGIGEGKIVEQIVEGDLPDGGGDYDGFFLDDSLRDDATNGPLAFQRGVAYLTAHQRPARSLPMRVRLKRDGSDPPLDPGSRVLVRAPNSRGLPPTSLWYVTGVQTRVGSEYAELDTIPLPTP